MAGCTVALYHYSGAPTSFFRPSFFSRLSVPRNNSSIYPFSHLPASSPPPSFVVKIRLTVLGELGERIISTVAVRFRLRAQSGYTMISRF